MQGRNSMLFSQFTIVFLGEVEVTRTDFVQTTVLSQVSGSLGLWLGLGALQASDIVIQHTVMLFNSIRRKITIFQRMGLEIFLAL